MGVDEIKASCKKAIEQRKKEIEDESFAKTLLRSLEKSNRRLFIICIILSLACGYMLWERSQYDYSSYTVTQELDKNGNLNFIGETGDIINGETTGN